MTPLILLVATLGLVTGLLVAAFWLVRKRFGDVSYASGIATVVLGLPLVIAATALALLTDTSTIFGPSIARPDLKVVDLEFLYRPTDVTGDWSVGIISKGFRPEVYLANVRTGDVRQLTDDGHQKYQAVVSGDIVAWIDQERGDEVVVLAMSTGEERRDHEQPPPRPQPDLQSECARQALRTAYRWKSAGVDGVPRGPGLRYLRLRSRNGASR